MILYLIRHGESAFNAAGRIQGQLDVPLSELGRQQSLALVDGLARFPIDVLFCSPLQRARQTAQPLADHFGLPLEFDSRLVELNAGIFQGLTWPELAARHPEEIARWRSYDPDYRIPEGESRRDLMQRAEMVLTQIIERAPEHAVIVSHGGLLSAGLKALLGIPAERNPFEFYNASVSRLEITPSRTKLLTLNDTEHLRRPGREVISRTGDL